MSKKGIRPRFLLLLFPPMIVHPPAQIITFYPQIITLFLCFLPSLPVFAASVKKTTVNGSTRIRAILNLLFLQRLPYRGGGIEVTFCGECPLIDEIAFVSG